MIDTFVLVSESHEVLLQHMEKNLPTDIQLNVCEEEQRCESGVFEQPGWLHAMHGKVEMLVNVCERWQEGEIVLHCDADIQFFTSEITPMLEEALASQDFCGQRDDFRYGKNVMCGGFFAFRVNPATRKLFHAILALMERDSINDQTALNVLLPESDLKFGFFPDWQVWCPRQEWAPGQELAIPPNALVHHANWTLGVPAKLNQLETARTIMAQHAENNQQ